MNEPVTTLYRRTQDPNCSDEDLATYYRFIRSELFKRAGLDKANPGELTKKRWEEIKFSEKMMSQEDLDETLETICLVYRQLVKHGAIIPHHQED